MMDHLPRIDLYVCCLIIISIFVTLTICLTGDASSIRFHRNGPGPGPELPDFSGTYSHTRTRISPLTGELIALPAPQQLAWQALEMSALIHYNIATYTDDDGCNNDPHEVPNINIFQPTQLNTDQWVQSMVDMGAGFAVLVTKHNCGFATWPTNASFSLTSGQKMPYNYSIGYSPVAGLDVVGNFIKSARQRGVKTGFYYSVVVNNFLNVQNGQVQGGALSPGQVNVTQDTYNDIVYQMLTELWTRYGELEEIWFDGGYTSSLAGNMSVLLAQHQPNTNIWNGCFSDNQPSEKCVSPVSARWIGNEDGRGPDPNWSTGVTNDGGSPDSPVFCPGGCDTALQHPQRWFWAADWPIRNLSTLIDIYHSTVGRNCVLELDFSPDRNGLIPANYAARYKQFGDWIRSCYHNPIIPFSNECTLQGLCTIQFLTPTSIDRIVIQEDQLAGQVIRSYTVDAIVVDQLNHNNSSNNVNSNYTILSMGTSVGNKKIDLFSPVNVMTVRLNITQYVDYPKIKSVNVFLCDEYTKEAKRFDEEEEKQKNHKLSQ